MTEPFCTCRQLWEAALQLCKELSGQYEEATFDYRQLSELLQSMSRLYDNILQEIRPVPAYFRVAFYGRGFPAFLQNKVRGCGLLGGGRGRGD